MAEQLTVTLERRGCAPGRARSVLAGFGHGLDRPRLRQAELLLTELVSNAVKHGGGGEVEVHLERGCDRFRAEVVDQGDGFVADPRHRAEPDTPGGWGLQLVDSLSDSWGTRQASTHVWFELVVG